ncbi:MAG: FAD-dependent thymidylate synthase [Candidatus Heimdallarchaeaceae archaeon]
MFIIQVKLISYPKEAELIAKMAGLICYSSEKVFEEIRDKASLKTDEYLEAIIKAGHLSILEHNVFVFYVTGISRACYDKKTEVYTKDGWKFFENLKKEDLFLTRDINGSVEFQSAERFIKYKYHGKMHHYTSQNFDLVVTPDHNLLLRRYELKKGENREFKLQKSNDFPQQRMTMDKRIRHTVEMDDYFIVKGYNYVRKNKIGKDYTVSTPDLMLKRKYFMQFLAWYLSEGSLYYNPKENSYRIVISQSSAKKSNRKEIEDVIRKLGCTPTILQNQIAFKNQTLGKFLKVLGKSFEKYIPLNLFEEFNDKYAKLFLETYVKGDGTKEKNGHMRIYTTSTKLANQIQILCFIAGYTGSIWIDDRIGLKRTIGKIHFENKRICYIVSISKGKRNRTPVLKMNKHFSEVSYDDYVYCVEVPKFNTLFVRRNGLAIWCGNCSHQLVRKRIASFSQQSQRYVDAENFEYVIPEEINKSTYGEKYKEIVNQTHELYQEMVNDGIPKEDARYILPNATSTQLIVSMNGHSLIDLLVRRICQRSQWEIRELAERMLEEVKKVAPAIFKNLGAFCDFYGYCPENSHSCGRAPTIDELKEKASLK